MCRIHEKHRPLARLRFGQTGFQLFGFEGGLLIGIGLGRDHAYLAALEPHFLHEDAGLRFTALDPRQCGNLMQGFLDCGRGMLLEMVFESGALCFQGTRGPIGVDRLQPCQPPLFVFVQVIAYGVRTYIRQLRNRIGVQFMALQP